MRSTTRRPQWLMTMDPESHALVSVPTPSSGLPVIERDDAAKKVVTGVQGAVLEIGIGTWGSLPLYGREVTHLVGLEPWLDSGLQSHLEQQLATVGRRAAIVSGSGEELPFRDARFDAVVVRWVLCSVSSVDRALAEIVRVLKPAGLFSYAEHLPRPGRIGLIDLLGELPPFEVGTYDCRQSRNSRGRISAHLDVIEEHVYDLDGARGLRPVVIGRARRPSRRRLSRERW